MQPLDQILLRYKKNKSSYKKRFKELKKKAPQDLDQRFAQAHHEVFQQIDCLDCARCCRELGPLILDRDIDRLAKELRMKPRDIIVQYLQVDEEGDYVFQSLPCPFILEDNRCMVYGQHPQACQKYPHTDQRRMKGRLNTLLKDCELCPAAVLVVDRILEMGQ